jgi:hypothetical protein
MHPVRIAQTLLLLATLGAVSMAPAATRQDFEEATSADGLEKIKVRNVDVVYARPGLTLAPYAKLRIEPVQVTFRKDFSPERTGSHFKLTTSELERIRSEVGAVVQDEFTKELARGSYAITDAAGPDVLQVRAEIVDLYVNAPDTMEPGRNNTFTMFAGEMTLVLTLADSETGAVLVRAYDRREARETGWITWTTGVSNRVETQHLAHSWANILRARLDAARGIGK